MTNIYRNSSLEYIKNTTLSELRIDESLNSCTLQVKDKKYIEGLSKYFRRHIEEMEKG